MSVKAPSDSPENTLPIDPELAYAMAHAESPGQLRVLVAMTGATAGLVTEDQAEQFARAVGVWS